MASRGGVESLCKGSAVRQLPDEHMTGKQTKVITAIGAIIKHPNGKLWHKFKKAVVWECAIYHHHIRRQLIDYANAQGQFTSRPNNDLDVTSFHPDQQAWGPTREHFPPILFEYAPPEKIKRAGELRYMYFHRHIVLDNNHRPVRAWPELNLTLSSKVEGFRLEALQRLNPHISSRDLLARMLPKIIIERNRKPDTVRSQLKANALSMRKREFRGRNGMLSWKIREGSKEIREYMDSLLGPELVAKNNTRGMRPLTESEIENIMYLIGKGRHPERSRNKPDNKPKSKPQRKPNNKATRGSKSAAQGERAGVAPGNPLLHENAEGDSDSEMPTDIEEHFEPMGLDGEQDDEDLGADVPNGIVNHTEPLHSDETEYDGTTFFTEQTPSEPDFDDPLDCRNHQPSDMVEAQIIALGIEHCIDQYKAWLNTDLVIDAAYFQWESYNTQWCALQEALERGWVDQGGDLDECPMLMRLPRWGGDIRSWSSA
ncbi:MAG: hypothetical protein Q9208_002800 [Pyrenodesmia sp. 3 TL-2023]